VNLGFPTPPAALEGQTPEARVEKGFQRRSQWVLPPYRRLHPRLRGVNVTTAALYQLEVKLGLAKGAFPPGSGWQLTMHIDPMEKGKGGKHPPGKVKRVNAALRELRELGVVIGTHKEFGRVDVVADHEQGALRLIEVEGESRRQKDQALYSSLGQLLLSMKLWSDQVGYGIAVPNTREWVRQVQKIPTDLTKRLHLWRYLVGPLHSVTAVEPGTEIPDWGRG